MQIVNHLMSKIILIVQLVKGFITAGIHNPEKDNDPRCLIPQDDFCGPGYAYIFSANICQKISGASCISANNVPFNTKEECESKCFINILPHTSMPVIDISSRIEKVQLELRNNKTESHSELLENYQENPHKSVIGILREEDSKTPTPKNVDISEKSSNLEQNDYDWYDYKDYMVNNVPRCEQPREVSMCRGFWPRWWFNGSAGECQEFTYGGCGRDDQTTNNFLTNYHCMTTCFEILPCPSDKSKACNVSTSECATPSCPANQDVICQVEPCTCKATYIDDFGDQVICIANNNNDDGGQEKLQMWVLWLCGVLSMIVLVLCIICCYRYIRPRASYRNFQQDTSISLDSGEGNFTPRKVFEKPVKA